MSRPGRRSAIAAAVAVLVVAIVAVVLLSAGGDDGRRDDGANAALERGYADAWQQTCVGLRRDAHDTMAAITARTATAAGRTPAALRRVATELAAPYVARSAQRLRAIEQAVPPPAWRGYQQAALPAVREARTRTDAVAAQIARGKLDALAQLDLSGLDRTPDAPASLRARTPACFSAGD